MSDAKELERRRAEVGRRYLLSQSPAEIARALECSLATVNRDLGVLRERWAAATERERRELLGETLAQVEHLQQQYQQGYDRSAEQREISVSSRIDSVNSAKSVSLRREPGRNSSSFLDGVGRCIDRKISLLGVAHKALAPTEQPPIPQMSEAELDAEFERLRPAFVNLGPHIEPGDTLPPGFAMPSFAESEGEGAAGTTRRERRRQPTPGPLLR